MISINTNSQLLRNTLFFPFIFAFLFTGSDELKAQSQPPAFIGDSTNIILWLDPDTGTYNKKGSPASMGEEVDEWVDLSNNGWKFSNQENSRLPELKKIDNKTYLDFENGDLLQNIPIKDSINGLEEFSIFMVVNSDVTGTNNGLLYWKHPPDGQDDGLCLRYDQSAWWNKGRTNIIKSGLKGNSGTHQVETTSNMQSDSKQTIAITWSSGGRLHSYINGEENDSSDNKVGGAMNSIKQVLLGKGAKDENPNEGWDGGIGTVIFYNEQFSDDTIQLISEDLQTSRKTVSSGTWDDPSTWECNCVPGDSALVTISDGDKIKLTQNRKVRGVTIHSNGVLQMGKKKLEISEHLRCNGQVQTSDSCEVVLKGTSKQEIKGKVRVHNLEINNPEGVSIGTDSRLDIKRELKIIEGDLNTNNNLRLLSGPNGTGRVAAIPSGSSVNGEVTVQRWIKSGNAGWIDLAAPNKDNVTLEEWDDDIYLSGKTTGGFDDGCAMSNGCFWSVKEYSNGSLNDVTSTSTPLSNGKGYELFIGDDGGVNIMKEDTTVSVKGTINSPGSITFNVPANDWAIIGNPFASPVNFDDITLNNVGPYFYVAAATGNYEWYDKTSGTSSHPNVSKYLSSSQAIWVWGNGNGASVTFRQNDKTSVGASFAKDRSNTPFSLVLIDGNSGLECNTTFQFVDENTESMEAPNIPYLHSPVVDAPGFFALDSSSNEVRSIKLTDNKEELTIPLEVAPYSGGVHSFKPRNIENAGRFNSVVLEDTKLNKTYDLKEEELINIKLSPSDSGSNRFLLHFGQEATSITDQGNDTQENLRIINGENGPELWANLPNTKETTISIYNSLGQEVTRKRTLQVSKGKYELPKPDRPGVYLVRVNATDFTKVRKVIFKTR